MIERIDMEHNQFSPCRQRRQLQEIQFRIYVDSILNEQHTQPLKKKQIIELSLKREKFIGKMKIDEKICNFYFNYFLNT